MNGQKQKIITGTGKWLTIIAGSVYGVIYVVIGYLINWDHCDALEGPFWKILVTAFHSVMMGTYVGKIIVKGSAKKIFRDYSKIRTISSKLFVIVFLGSIAAFIVSWEVGYIFGKTLGIMHEITWEEILVDIPFISLIHAIPFVLVISILYRIFVFIFLKFSK